MSVGKGISWKRFRPQEGSQRAQGLCCACSLPRAVWTHIQAPFLPDQPPGVPSPGRVPEAQQLPLPQSPARLQHLQHSSNIFYAAAKIFFWGWEINFLPKSIFKQQVRTNPPTVSFELLEAALPLHGAKLQLRAEQGERWSKDCSALS